MHLSNHNTVSWAKPVTLGVSTVPVAMTVSALVPSETFALNLVSVVSMDTGHLQEPCLHPMKVN